MNERRVTARLLRAGQLAEADKLCTRVLKTAPDYFDALHLGGVIKLHSGKAGAGLAMIDAALKLNPNVPEALANRGMQSESLAKFLIKIHARIAQGL